MVTTARAAAMAALVGDPSRLAMLMATMDGRAFTAGELARVAGIAPQTASGHLSQLSTAGLLQVLRQGRHRYYRLASPEVARMIEAIFQATASALPSARPPVVGPRDAALRSLRTCYDHLAGRLAVALADSLVEQGHLELTPDGGALTASGEALVASLELQVPSLQAEARRGGRVFCRPCLDWSERRFHLGGALGSALRHRFLELGWLRRAERTRAVFVTPVGHLALRERFGLRVEEPPAAQAPFAGQGL